MLSAKGDQILDGGIGTPLGHCSQELTPLTEPHGMVPVGQVRVVLYLFTHLCHLVVDVHNETIQSILDYVVANLKIYSLLFTFAGQVLQESTKKLGLF